MDEEGCSRTVRREMEEDKENEEAIEGEGRSGMEIENV